MTLYIPSLDVTKINMALKQFINITFKALKFSLIMTLRMKNLEIGYRITNIQRACMMRVVIIIPFLSLHRCTCASKGYVSYQNCISITERREYHLKGEKRIFEH